MPFNKLCCRDTIVASRKPSAVLMEGQLGDNPTYDCPRGPSDDKRRTDAETQIQESLRNE